MNTTLNRITDLLVFNNLIDLGSNKSITKATESILGLYTYKHPTHAYRNFSYFDILGRLNKLYTLNDMGNINISNMEKDIIYKDILENLCIVIEKINAKTLNEVEELLIEHFYLSNVITFKEAVLKLNVIRNFNFDPSNLKVRILKSENFTEGIDYKRSGSTWLIKFNKLLEEFK